jgi:N-acetylglucosaminyl-diphospho-decaprenol L-rhamnosyltransferase
MPEATSQLGTLDPKIDLSIVVVNYNTCHLLAELFASIARATQGLSIQVIVVDNASTDRSVEHLQKSAYPIDLVLNQKNVGFGRANNQALPLVRGRHVLLLNTDAFVSQDTLTKTVAWMDEHPACGVLGVKLIGRDGALQPSCRYRPTIANIFLNKTGLAKGFPAVQPVDDMAWPHDAVRECDWVPGCYYLIRREVLSQVGLFDPRFFMYYEEVDHCIRVQQAGWKVCFYPFTQVVHIGGESAKSVAEISRAGRQISALQVESEWLFMRKHHGLWGLWRHLSLLVLADLIQLGKDLLKRRGRSVALRNLARTRSSWTILTRTRWGLRPTR